MQRCWREALSTAIRGGATQLGWLWLYLLLAGAIHIAVAVRIGAFEKMERELTGWWREFQAPAQVALERALIPTPDVAAVRAAIAAGADPNALLAGIPLSPLIVAADAG